MLEPYTIGSITYSEGIHDDVNKILWADQDFDSSVAAEETMADYANLFIDSETSEQVAEFLMDVEHNWDGQFWKTTESMHCMNPLQHSIKPYRNR